jgi:hypothetical protein
MVFKNKMNLTYYISNRLHKGFLKFQIYLYLTILFFFSISIHPHPSLLTSFEVDVYPSKVSIEIKVPLEDLEKALQINITKENILYHKDNLNKYFLEHIHIKSIEGNKWTASIEGEFSFNETDNSKEEIDLITIMNFRTFQNEMVRTFIIDSDLVQREVLDHKIIIYLRKDWESGIFSEDPKIIGSIRFANNSITVDRKDSSLWVGFLSTFKLGMRHILEGYDHLLFLFMLLLPAPLIKLNKSYEYKKAEDTFFYLFKIVSAFTVGHSLTLALGAIQLINPPLPLIEVIIAISVLVSAINVIHPILHKTEFWIAGSFGLIHGLAFSSTVSEFGLHSTQLILSILGFNLGIELIQFLVIIVCIPLLFLIIKFKQYILFKNLAGIFGVILSVIWIIDRAKELY